MLGDDEPIEGSFDIRLDAMLAAARANILDEAHAKRDAETHKGIPMEDIAIISGGDAHEAQILKKTVGEQRQVTAPATATVH